MTGLRILYIGCVEFSALGLQKCIEAGFPPVAVVTKKQSQYNSDFADLSLIADRHGIPCKYANDINHDANIDWIKQYYPDVIFCFGWSSLIKKELLSVPQLGVVGFHPTLLPHNRGRHPIIWALVLGLKQTGSSFFFMDEGADTGDILSQQVIKIESSDTARTLYNKIAKTALAQLADFLPLLENRTYQKTQQPRDVGNTWRKRTRKDGRIDFRMNPADIVNLVKALSKPYPGAHMELESGDVLVWSAEISVELESDSNIEPGKVIQTDGSKVKVKCGIGSVWLIEHELQHTPSVGDYMI